MYRSVSRHPSHLDSSSHSQKSTGLLLNLVRGGDDSEGVHLSSSIRSHFFDLLQAAARLPSLKFHAQVVLVGRQVACARGYSHVLHLHSKHAHRPRCSEARARQPRFEMPTDTPPSRAGAFVGRPRGGYGQSRRLSDTLGVDGASSSQAALFFLVADEYPCLLVCTIRGVKGVHVLRWGKAWGF
jgi:hypothetical protein